jgi:hypothetical protein
VVFTEKKPLDAKIRLFQIHLTFPVPPRRYCIPATPKKERYVTSPISIKYWLNVERFGLKLLFV